MYVKYGLWGLDIFIDFGAAPNRRRVRCAARGVLSAMHPTRAYFIIWPLRGLEVQCARAVLLHLLLALTYHSWVCYYGRTMLWAILN